MGYHFISVEPLIQITGLDGPVIRILTGIFIGKCCKPWPGEIWTLFTKDHAGHENALMANITLYRFVVPVWYNVYKKIYTRIFDHQ